MLGYIVSPQKYITVKNHTIHNFDVACHKQKHDYIFIVENGVILYNNSIVFNACKHGHVQVLNWMKKSKIKIGYAMVDISVACEYGHVEILTWFKNNLTLPYNINYVRGASKNKHIDVLNFLISNFSLQKYTDSFVNIIYNFLRYNDGYIVLEWFKNNLLDILCEKKCINWMLEYSFDSGRLKAIKWLLQNFKINCGMILSHIYNSVKNKNYKIIFYVFDYFGPKKFIKKFIFIGRLYRVSFKNLNTYRFKIKNKYFKGYKKN